MAKELTREDLLKKEYSELNKINQRLKNISSGYYISYNGEIYMKSIIEFLDKFIILKNPEKLIDFNGFMIMPNEFFEFSKQAKKTKLTIDENDQGFILGQIDSDELSITLTKSNPFKDSDEEYIYSKIKPNMYKRFFDIQGDDYNIFEDSAVFTELTDDEIDRIINAKMIQLNYKGSILTLTKHLMLDIKKNDLVSIARISYQEIDGTHYRVFYMLKQETELYIAYTIFNTLQTSL